MPKTNFQKTTAFLTSFIMLFTATACGENNSSLESLTEVMPVTQTMYKEERLVMPDDYNSLQYMDYVEKLEKFYLIYSDFSGNHKLCVLNNDFQTESTEILCEKSNTTESFYHIDSAGEIAQLKYICDYTVPEGSEYDEQHYLENAVISFKLARYDENGLISETDVTGMEEYYNLLESRNDGFVKLDDGQYVVNFYTSLVKFDENGKILDNVQSDGTNFIGTDNKGQLVTSEWDSISYIEKGSLNKISQEIKTTDYLRINGNIREGTNGYKMYMKMNEGYFGLTENNEFVKILDFVSSNIIGSEVYDICSGSEGHILMYCVNMAGTPYISKLTVRPDDYVENKETVIFGTIDPVYDDVRQIITEFTKQSDNYKLESKVYGDYDSFHKALISGESPDVFMYWNSADMYMYANSGAFANMYDYMDKYGGFSKEDVRDHIIEAFEYKDGLYGISAEFQIIPYIANSEVVGKEYTNWSYEDMYSLAENMPDDMSFTQSFTFNTRKDVFDNFGAYNTNAWIDYETGECDFNSESFIKFLEFCRDVPMMNETDWSAYEDQQPIIEEQNAMLFNKKALIAISHGGSNLSSVMDVERTYHIAQENLTYLGLPSEEHKGSIYAQRFYSVIANGSCPEGAWEFINYIMSAEYQENTLGALVSGSFVTRKDSFERNLNRFQQTKSVEGEVHYFYEVLDEEALETFIPYLDTCTVLRHHDGYIAYIMDEEFDEFINGNISAQECADRIQSRVSIYLAEQW